ncbi:MAG: hypothetical protein JW794_05195 [Candidatus Cloacimonetes bacterium]|nr:hypothetical protein [Candidatus Cloacimonadota bacterium]
MLKRIIIFVFIILLLFNTILLSNPPNWHVISGTQYSMILIAQITFNGDIFEGGVSNNMAGAFGPGGESDCRSIAAWQVASPPYWDGYWYFTIVGNDNCDCIYFKIYNDPTDSVYDCTESLLFQDNITIGEPTNPYQLHTYPISVSHNGFNDFDICTYPNPFTENVHFSVPVEHINDFVLTILDIKGRFIRFFYPDDIDKKGAITWSCLDVNGFQIPSGVYLYIYLNKNYTSYGKIVLIKE